MFNFSSSQLSNIAQMEKGQLIESSVLDAVKNGDRAAYATIFKIYYGRLYNYGYKFTKNVSLIEDCLQEVLTSFWVNRQKIENVISFDSYLFVSFRNRLIKGLQNNRLKTEDLIGDEYEFEFDLSIDQVMIDAERLYEQKIDLRAALEKLTQRQKEVLYFKFYESLSYEQISGILGISTKATYKLLGRAVSELRRIYQKKISTFSILFIISLSCISF